MSRLRERLRGLVAVRPWPFHPVLFAAYFVLFLYSANLDEAEFSDVLPVLIPVVLATAVLLVAGGIVIRDVRRAGIVLSAAVVALLAYGHVGGLLEPTKIGPGYQQLSWGLFGLLALVVAWRAVGWIPRLTRILNVIALVLVIVPVVSIVPHELGRLSVAAAGPGPGATASPETPAAGGPDIYWFVFDRYPSASSLQLAYGLENPIFDELRSRGFYVADRSHANYQQTTFSVTSTFSAEFLDGRGHADIFGPTDVSGEFSRIENSNVGRFLKARGYFYAHIGSDFSPTRTSKIADVNHAYDGFSDFETAFVESTAVPGIARRLGILPSPWKRRYDWTTWELNLLDRLPPYPSPKFVFSHLLLPHPPYIFGRDGQFLDETANRGRAAKEQFEEQLTYTNTRLLAIIDRLLALPEDERPVIIVQADEGPYPAGLRDNTGHDWTKETPERREIKFGILNAWYLPGGRDIGLYPEITPVNTFRILFDAYFGTDLPLLPDESYSVNHPEPLTFPEP